MPARRILHTVFCSTCHKRYEAGGTQEGSDALFHVEREMRPDELEREIACPRCTSHDVVVNVEAPA